MRGCEREYYLVTVWMELPSPFTFAPKPYCKGSLRCHASGWNPDLFRKGSPRSDETRGNHASLGATCRFPLGSTAGSPNGRTVRARRRRWFQRAPSGGSPFGSRRWHGASISKCSSHQSGPLSPAIQALMCSFTLCTHPVCSHLLPSSRWWAFERPWN